MEPDFEDRLVLLDGLGDGHLHLVAQEVGLLVARLDFRQHLLGIGGLEEDQEFSIRDGGQVVSAQLEIERFEVRFLKRPILTL